jgi:lysophospholipase L1-like esterase
VSRAAKRFAFTAVTASLALLLPYLVAEGLYSVSKGEKAATSLAAALYAHWLARRPAPALDPRDPNTQMLADIRELEALLPAFKANGVGLGNSPYRELKSEAAAVNREQDGCLAQKPNVRKRMAFLRSNLFNPFDQPTFFVDADRVLPAALETFFARYAFRTVYLTTNPHGERLTLPAVAAPAKVLVAGDSVANGVMLDDAETIASQLQAADRDRQYVNLGIARAAGADIACALDKAARRYAGQVARLLYVLCENDFEDTNDPYAQPETLIARLAEFQRRERIEGVVLLYTPYVYNVVPEVMRVRGHSDFDFPTYREEKRRLFAAAGAAGFAVVDYLDVVHPERLAAGSQFAPLALYLDRTHPSPRGVALLVAHLRVALSAPHAGPSRSGAASASASLPSGGAPPDR